MLTSIGGLIGVAAGIVMAKVISQMSKTPVAISVPAIAFPWHFHADRNYFRTSAFDQGGKPESY